MALSYYSLLNYGIQIGTSNQYIDFKASALGPELTGTIDIGFYSPASLADAIVAAMQAVDPLNSYSCTVNRTVAGGTQNRLTIATTGTFLSILFGSGSHAASSVAITAGFNRSDYTGATSYTGSASTGIVLIPELIGYNFQDPKQTQKVFGAVNISAAGIKEAVVFNFQKFYEVEFRNEPKSRLLEWQNFFSWAIQQRPFDFTPELNVPTVFNQVTLESTQADGKGLSYLMKEMLPQFPNQYTTGPLTFRVVDELTAFTTQV